MVISWLLKLGHKEKRIHYTILLFLYIFKISTVKCLFLKCCYYYFTVTYSGFLPVSILFLVLFTCLCSPKDPNISSDLKNKMGDWEGGGDCTRSLCWNFYIMQKILSYKMLLWKKEKERLLAAHIIWMCLLIEQIMIKCSLCAHTVLCAEK